MTDNTDRYADQWQNIDLTPSIEQAIAQLADDAGAIFEKDLLAA